MTSLSQQKWKRSPTNAFAVVDESGRVVAEAYDEETLAALVQLPSLLGTTEAIRQRMCEEEDGGDALKAADRWEALYGQAVARAERAERDLADARGQLHHLDEARTDALRMLGKAEQKQDEARRFVGQLHEASGCTAMHTALNAERGCALDNIAKEKAAREEAERQLGLWRAATGAAAPEHAHQALHNLRGDLMQAEATRDAEMVLRRAAESACAQAEREREDALTVLQLKMAECSETDSRWHEAVTAHGAEKAARERAEAELAEARHLSGDLEAERAEVMRALGGDTDDSAPGLAKARMGDLRRAEASSAALLELSTAVRQYQHRDEPTLLATFQRLMVERRRIADMVDADTYNVVKADNAALLALATEWGCLGLGPTCNEQGLADKVSCPACRATRHAHPGAALWAELQALRRVRTAVEPTRRLTALLLASEHGTQATETERELVDACAAADELAPR